MFKPGDKVRVKDGKDNDLWKGHPEIMEVIHVSHKSWGEYISIVGNPANGKSGHDETKNWVYEADMFDLVESVDTIPAETIEHEGYIYNRGEKISPSWLKDGKWLIHEFDGGLRQVRQKSEGVYNIMVTEDVGVRYHEGIRNQYRPFEEKDWKWGMYCEYGGEVWVVSYMPKIPEYEGQKVYLGNGISFTSTFLGKITPTFKR